MERTGTAGRSASDLLLLPLPIRKGPPRTPDPVVAEPSFAPATPIPDAKGEAEAEASTTAEFADQEQRVDEALQNYRSSQASIPDRGRRMERTNTAGSSASGPKPGSEGSVSRK
ncbi:hypothetical protein PG988_005627 [Apiospora saccharicola]